MLLNTGEENCIFIFLIILSKHMAENFKDIKIKYFFHFKTYFRVFDTFHANYLEVSLKGIV